MRDPVAAQFPWHRRLRVGVKHHVTRVIRWRRWLALFAMMAVASLALGLVVNARVSAEAKKRTQQLQDVICQVYVPIGALPLGPKVTVIGRTIIAATRHGALDLHCPGVK